MLRSSIMMIYLGHFTWFPNESLKGTLAVVLRTICRCKTFPITNLSHSVLNTNWSKRTKLVTFWTLLWTLLNITSFNPIFQTLMLYLHLPLHLCILVWIPLDWRSHLVPFKADVCNFSTKCPFLRLIKIQNTKRSILWFSSHPQPPECRLPVFRLISLNTIQEKFKS